MVKRQLMCIEFPFVTQSFILSIKHFHIEESSMGSSSEYSLANAIIRTSRTGLESGLPAIYIRIRRWSNKTRIGGSGKVDNNKQIRSDN